MKANELMIGDFVYDASYYSIQVKANYGRSIQYEEESYSHEIEETLLHAIPLTEEILKVNGFEKTGDYVSVHENGSRFETYGNHVFSYRSNVICDIFYVHELQHALRLCGLTELADNFKIE